LALAGAVLTAAGAGAATQFVSVDAGSTSSGSYVIDRGPNQADGVCLHLRFAAHRPAYGCADRPDEQHAFGLVVADSAPGSAQRVIYGLVAANVARVTVLGDGDARTDATPRPSGDLPGQFFSVTVPDRGRIELVAYDASARELARLGSRAEPTQPAGSLAELRAQGNPAGFAPGPAVPGGVDYRGRALTIEEAKRHGLICTQGSDDARCYDLKQQLETAESRRP
jgi:hypothetical protein